MIQCYYEKKRIWKKISAIFNAASLSAAFFWGTYCKAGGRGEGGFWQRLSGGGDVVVRELRSESASEVLGNSKREFGYSKKNNCPFSEAVVMDRGRFGHEGAVKFCIPFSSEKLRWEKPSNINLKVKCVGRVSGSRIFMTFSIFLQRKKKNRVFWVIWSIWGP